MQELKDKSNITDEFITPALTQLCHPKMRILDKPVKRPNFDDPNEKIKINLNLTNNNIRINLKPVKSMKKKTEEEDTKILGDVEKDRQMKI